MVEEKVTPQQDRNQIDMRALGNSFIDKLEQTEVCCFNKHQLFINC